MTRPRRLSIVDQNGKDLNVNTDPTPDQQATSATTPAPTDDGPTADGRGQDRLREEAVTRGRWQRKVPKTGFDDEVWLYDASWSKRVTAVSPRQARDHLRADPQALVFSEPLIPPVPPMPPRRKVKP